MKRELKDFIRWASERGWIAGRTKNNHLTLTHERAGTIVFPSTPSDWRGVKNTKARLLRREKGFTYG